MISDKSNNNYQLHIDGIRAIAVLAVIAFHANSTWLPGGFVGVDIFFVISGYLISGLIFKQVISGSFSFSDFFVRRIRRIFPALLVVITFSFFFAWMVLLPDEMRSFSKSIFTSIFMHSNRQFLGEAGYFDTQSHLKPLLHTWSLSIEGQFYLLFPIIFIFLLRYTNHLILTVAFLTFISFFYADRISLTDIEKNFFYFFARAWELLAGCLLMLFLQQGNSQKKIINQTFSLLGMCLIFYAIFFFDRSMPHPSKITLIPVIGTLLLIAFSSEQTLVGKLLTSKAMISIGLISYSLYLWHQPIISFAKTEYVHLNLFKWLIIFLLIALFSTLSWKFIEQPFRSNQFISSSNFLVATVTSAMILSAIGLWGYQNNGFIKQRFSKEKLQLINALDADNYKSFLFKNLYGNEISKYKYHHNGKPWLLVVGDSYAADFMNMIVNNHYLKGYQVRTLHIPARCQFYLGDRQYLDWIDKKDSFLCESTQKNLTFLKHNLGALDQVIFVFQWEPWAAEHVKKSIEALDIKDNKRLIFIGSKRFIVNKREIINSDIETVKSLTTARVDSVMKINQTLAKQVKPHIFIDQDQIFCGVNNQCQLFTDQSLPISVDGQHLTQEGATYLGKLLFSDKTLNKLNSRK